jgi:hypothetical protein
MVVKRLRDTTCWDKSMWNNDMLTMHKAMEFAEEWNALGRMNKTLKVLSSTIEVCSSENVNEKFKGGSFVMVEPFIQGEYEKWNSNSGWMADDALSINAFCHWTYHHSKGKLLFCDVQGVRNSTEYVITDPCIMSDVEGQYGMTDCGGEVMRDWLRKHKCNKFCSSMWRREVGASQLPTRRRSTMSWENKFGKPSVTRIGMKADWKMASFVEEEESEDEVVQQLQQQQQQQQQQLQQLELALELAKAKQVELAKARQVESAKAAVAKAKRDAQFYSGPQGANPNPTPNPNPNPNPIPNSNLDPNPNPKP